MRRRRDANPRRERSETHRPASEAADRHGRCGTQRQSVHSPWIKESAPGSATSSPARARSAWRGTTTCAARRCSPSARPGRRVQIRTMTPPIHHGAHRRSSRIGPLAIVPGAAQEEYEPKRRILERPVRAVANAH